MLQRTGSFALLLLATATSLFLAGCLDRTVVGGEGGGSEDDGTASSGVVTSTTTGTSAAGGPAAPGVALFELEAALPCDFDPCPPDDMLYLVVDTDGVGCTSPTGSPPGTGGFAFRIGLPPALQQVGRYDLRGREDVYSHHEEYFVNDANGAVGTVGVGMGSADGTLEILAIDDTSVVFTVSGVTYNVPSDGEYTATRCGATSLPPEGIALTGATLPGGEGGGPADDEAITVVVGDALASCDAELPSTCSGGAWQVAVTLPAAYLVPGLVSLADPLVTATDCADASSEVAESIEIAQVTDDALIVHFIGAVDHLAELEQDVRIARCP
jgi:hypothetical protein